MNLDYERIKQQHGEGGSHWTSYSDLFMALSFLFLLLYVVASFRTGTVSHSANLKQSELMAKQRELESQMKIYDRISKNYLDQQANEKEKKLYENVMAQLDLLDNTSQQKQKELQETLEKEQKKQVELNRYQKTIKNLITANMNSAKDIKEREKRLSKRMQDLNALEFSLRKKQRELKLTGNELKETTSKLKRTAEREKAIKQKASQQEVRYKKELAALTLSAKKKIENITRENQSRINTLIAENDQKLKKLQNEYEEKQMDLQKRTAELESAQKTISEQAKQNKILLAEAEGASKEAEKRINELKRKHQEKMEQEKQQHLAKIKAARLSAQDKLAAEKAYREKIEAENSKFNNKLSGLENELQSRDSELSKLKGQQESLAEKNSNLSNQLQSAQNQASTLQQKLKEGEQEAEAMRNALAAAKEKADRRKNISKKIMQSFRDSGLDVDINPNTGDLILNFGNEYFDTGKFFLKPGMRNTLDRAVPIYATSLFEDVAISKHINAVEIVGFASPTYKNRVVDPNSLEPSDRRAIDYNLDLSYKRARAIFQHIFDTNKMNFVYQSKLLPLVKVTGRSFFTQAIEGKEDTQMDMKSFCKKFDCNSAQKVIIRFNLKD